MRDEAAGALTSRQMMIIVCFLVVGFVCMALGLHALRRVKTQRAIQSTTLEAAAVSGSAPCRARGARHR